MSFHHKRITKFDIRGSIYDEAHIDRLKREYISLLVCQMKADGYVPRSDIDPQFSLSYTGGGYDFHLSVYGIFVGKKQAQELEGVFDYKPIYSCSVGKKESKKKSTETA